MSNPFNLSGTEFLIFYIVLVIAVNLLLKYLFLKVESCFPAAKQDCTDPYKLAALRGGTTETMKIVFFSLFDRGLLKVNVSGTTVAAEPQAKQMVDHPVEWAVVSYFQMPRTVQEFLSDSDTMNAGKKFCRKLADEGLLADISVYLWRTVPALAALALLVCLPVDSNGQTRSGWMAWAVIVFACWVILTWFRRLTGAGVKVLQRARHRFNHLKKNAERVRPGGDTNDATILAATFGMAALPAAHFSYVTTLFPKESEDSD
jgi:uncharacterized protein (TIGR04222 family)